ncbi:MAG: thioredoxin domain-containing protein [Gammaproteobacteria bacterium]|nr:thioredoxin domain-containing protein [Gammaproteobacteria bacterium]
MSPLLNEFSNTQIKWQLACHHALEKRSRELPVLMIIGSSGCPHTQALIQTIENDNQLSQLINLHFSSYLVDKYESPQIDEYCQDFHLNFTQSIGAWPLLVLLEPEQLLPFYSTVAFNPTLDLNLYEQLDSIGQIIKQDSRMMRQTALVLQEKFAKQSDIETSNTFSHQPFELSDVVDTFVQLTFGQADLQWGGLMSVPKFPHSTLHQTLLSILVQRRPKYSEDLYQHLMRTLQSLLRTGIYDHLSGGFFRFCHDQHWQHPQFEKSVLDNAQLIIFLTQVAQFNKDAATASSAYETAQWIINNTKDPLTGLYAAAVNQYQSNIEDSGYLIDKEEIKTLFNDDEWSIVNIAFGFDKSPMTSNTWHIQCWFTPEVIAEKLQLPLKQVQYQISPLKEKLKDFRLSKLKLQLSHSLSISTNSKILVALLAVGQLKNDDKIIDAANELDKKIEEKVKLLFNDSQTIELNFESLANFIEAQLTLLQYQWNEQKFKSLIQIIEFTLSNYYVDSKFKTDRNTYPWSFQLVGYDQNNDNPLATFYSSLVTVANLIGHNNHYKECIELAAKNLADFFLHYKLKASSVIKALLQAEKTIILLFGNNIETLEWFEELQDKSLKYTIFRIPLSSSVASSYQVKSACAICTTNDNVQTIETKEKLRELIIQDKI